MCTMFMSLSLEWHKKTHPDLLFPNVYLTCILPGAGLLSFLVYNFLLLVICALLTSHTSDAENEERTLIFTCTNINLVIWIKSVAKALVEHHARTPVVVLILTAARVQKLITWTQHFLLNETFVWIGTDAWSGYADGLVDNNLLLDSLLVDVPRANIHSFDDWFIQLRPVSVFAPSIYD
ncbi:hypothetical protein ACOMHN_036918 [Nucella lapillus]